MGTTRDWCVSFWTNLGSNTPQYSSCTAPPTGHLTNYLSKTNKTCETLLKKQAQTFKGRSHLDSCPLICKCWPTSSSVWTHDAALKNFQEQWMIRMDNDRVAEHGAVSANWWWWWWWIYIYIYIYIYILIFILI